MNRRTFFHRLTTAAALTTVAPKLLHAAEPPAAAPSAPPEPAPTPLVYLEKLNIPLPGATNHDYTENPLAAQPNHGYNYNICYTDRHGNQAPVDPRDHNPTYLQYQEWRKDQMAKYLELKRIPNSDEWKSHRFQSR